MLDKVSISSTFLLIIFYLIFFKRNNDKKFWVIFLYVVLSLAADALFARLKLDAFYSFSLFTLIEFSIFSYFFYLSYKDRSSQRPLVWCYLIFCMVLVYSVLYNSNYKFDYLTSSFEAILVIIFSIIYFYEQLKNPEIGFVYASKSFWIITAILIYMSATLILFISTSVISSNLQETETVWLINNVANIIKNILFAIAFSKPLIMSIDISSGKTDQKNKRR